VKFNRNMWWELSIQFIVGWALCGVGYHGISCFSALFLVKSVLPLKNQINQGVRGLVRLDFVIISTVHNFRSLNILFFL